MNFFSGGRKGGRVCGMKNRYENVFYSEPLKLKSPRPINENDPTCFHINKRVNIKIFSSLTTGVIACTLSHTASVLDAKYYDCVE